MYDKRMDNLPLFISFPRTGSQWLNCVMELYFNRPRLREGRVTFMPLENKNWMWFHDHDLMLDIKHDNVLYLYRNPIDTIYSYTMAEIGEIREGFIIKQSKLYHNHLKKYLLDGGAKTYLRYDNLQNNLPAEFRKVCNFFNMKFLPKKIEEINKKVTKESIMKRVKSKSQEQYLNKKMITTEYAKNREQFIYNFGEKISSIVLLKGLRRFFQ